MAKLYAELTSDKGGRVASKGGDKWLEIDIKVGNNLIQRIVVDQQSEKDFTITEYDNKGQHLVTRHL